MGAKPERVGESFESEAFSQKETPSTDSPDVGALLRQERIKQNKKIPAISRELRISESYILALEEGNIAALPERVYTLGFVRTYALYLGLDAASVVERFKKESLGLDSFSKTYVLPEAYLPQKGPSRRILGSSLFFGVLLTGGWLFYHFYAQTHEDNAADAEIAPPVLEAPAQEKDHSSTESVAPIGNGAEKEHPSYSQEAEDFALGLLQSPAPGMASIAPAPDNPITKTLDQEEGKKAPAVTIQESVSPQPDTSQSTASPVLENAQTNAELVFTESTWVQILDGNGRIYMEKLFKPGDHYVIPKGDRFAMRVGNGGGVFVAQGDQKSPTLGRKGQVLSHVLLDQKSIEEYLTRQ